SSLAAPYDQVRIIFKDIDLLDESLYQGKTSFINVTASTNKPHECKNLIPNKNATITLSPGWENIPETFILNGVLFCLLLALFAALTYWTMKRWPKDDYTEQGLLEFLYSYRSPDRWALLPQLYFMRRSNQHHKHDLNNLNLYISPRLIVERSLEKNLTTIDVLKSAQRQQQETTIGLLSSGTAKNSTNSQSVKESKSGSDKPAQASLNAEAAADKINYQIATGKRQLDHLTPKVRGELKSSQIFVRHQSESNLCSDKVSRVDQTAQRRINYEPVDSVKSKLENQTSIDKSKSKSDIHQFELPYVKKRNHNGSADAEIEYIIRDHLARASFLSKRLNKFFAFLLWRDDVELIKVKGIDAYEYLLFERH
ncbi:hypothetical protein GZH46_01263, partial [Fragariocoptes setiger]